MKPQIEYFIYKNKKVILTGIKSVFVRHGGKSDFRHIIEIDYEDGKQDYIFCLDFESGGAVWDKDYWIESDGYIHYKTALARKIDEDASIESEKIAEKIRKFLYKKIKWKKVNL